MANVQLVSNTTQKFPCIQCGGSGNIIRESPDPRIKCTQCGMTYDGSQSKAAQEAGEIPDGPPQLQDPNPPATQVDREPKKVSTTEYNTPSGSEAVGLAVPRTPAYVFVSKDRTRVEFVGKRDLKRTALKWESVGKYDLFELQSKKSSVNVSIE